MLSAFFSFLHDLLDLLLLLLLCYYQLPRLPACPPVCSSLFHFFLHFDLYCFNPIIPFNYLSYSSFLHSFSLSSPFLGSGHKGPMSCRTHGGISRRPSFCPSPIDHQGLKLALPGLNLALQTSNQPSWLQISLPHASNLPFRPQICPPDLQSAFQASNQPSKPQICSPSLISAL